MSEYVLVTDSACDISPEMLEEWGVTLIRMPYLFQDNGEQHLDHDQECHEFYDEMRAGRVAKTSSLNADTYTKTYSPLLRWIKKTRTSELTSLCGTHSILAT